MKISTDREGSKSSDVVRDSRMRFSYLDWCRECPLYRCQRDCPIRMQNLRLVPPKPTDKIKAFISPASSADRTSIIRSNREHHFLRGSPTQSNNLTIYLRYSLFDRDSSMLLSDSDSSRCQRLEASDSVWMWVVHGSCWRGSSAHKFGCQVCEYGCLMSWITRTWNLLSSSAIIASTINWFSFSFYVENCGGRY